MLMTRRRWLKGVGASLALPPLESMLRPQGLRAAGAATGGIHRLLIFHNQYGVDFPNWTPLGAKGAPVNTPVPMPANASQILSVLDQRGVRQDVTVLGGLSQYEVGRDFGGKLGDWVGHDNAHQILLTGSRPLTAPSIDQIIAAKLAGSGAPVDSISVMARGPHGYGLVLSYNKSGAPIDPYRRPLDVFNKLFLAKFDPQLFERMRQKKLSVLDFLKDSIRDVQRRSTRTDRTVLDQYLTTVNEVGSKLGVTANLGQCQVNGDWQSRSMTIDDGFKDLFGGTGKPTEPILKSWSDLMIEMITAALQCDLLPVAVISLFCADLRWPTLSNFEDHQISHLSIAGNSDYLYGNNQAQQNLLATSKWRVDRFCDLLARMKQLRLADGRTLLDDTAVVYVQEHSSAPNHCGQDLPVLVAGGGLGGGRSINYVCPPGPNGISKNALILNNADRCNSASGYTPLANLWLTVARAAGIEAATLPKFGNSNGTLAGLWS